MRPLYHKCAKEAAPAEEELLLVRGYSPEVPGFSVALSQKAVFAKRPKQLFQRPFLF